VLWTKTTLWYVSAPAGQQRKKMWMHLLHTSKKFADNEISLIQREIFLLHNVINVVIYDYKHREGQKIWNLK